MYLKNDIVGQATGRLYGKAGDAVTIKDSPYNDKFHFVEKDGTVFLVHEDDLTEEKPEHE